MDNLKNEILKNGTELIDAQISESASVYKDTKVTRSYIGSECSIGDHSTIFESELIENVSINRRVHVTSSQINFGTYVNHNTSIRDAVIGKFCCISWDVSIGGKDHNYKSAAMYTPYWWKKTFGYTDEIKVKKFAKCRIGNDVWIGSGAIILRNVTVGDGAVIGAGAVVTKDVEPYAIVAGSPARSMKKRFDEKTIDALLEMKWWDWPKDIIKQNINYLSQDLTPEVMKILQTVYRENKDKV